MKNNCISSTFKVLLSIIFLSTISFSSAVLATPLKFDDSYKVGEAPYINEDVNNKIEDGSDNNKSPDLKDCDNQQSIPKSVPEPFTVIGTLVGGVVAFRTRNKLKAKVS